MVQSMMQHSVLFQNSFSFKFVNKSRDLYLRNLQINISFYLFIRGSTIRVSDNPVSSTTAPHPIIF
jgi:hypothetical protein